MPAALAVFFDLLWTAQARRSRRSPAASMSAGTRDDDWSGTSEFTRSPHIVPAGARRDRARSSPNISPGPARRPRAVLPPDRQPSARPRAGRHRVASLPPRANSGLPSVPCCEMIRGGLFDRRFGCIRHSQPEFGPRCYHLLRAAGSARRAAAPHQRVVKGMISNPTSATGASSITRGAVRC